MWGHCPLPVQYMYHMVHVYRTQTSPPGTLPMASPGYNGRTVWFAKTLCGVPCGPIEKRTQAHRLHYKPGALAAYGLDLLASLAVFLAHILTYDTLLSVTISITSVLLIHHYGTYLSLEVPVGVLSVGVIFPITRLIQQSFARRELALRSFVLLRCYSLALFSAHVTWDWPASKDTSSGGRERLPPSHVPAVRQLLNGVFTAIETYCLLPRGGHARFSYTPCGVREAAELQQAIERQIRRVERGFGRLYGASEALKAAGLSGSEVHAPRARAWPPRPMHVAATTAWSHRPTHAPAQCLVAPSYACHHQQRLGSCRPVRLPRSRAPTSSSRGHRQSGR